MIVRRDRFGAIDPATLTAAMPEPAASGQFSLGQYFLVAVAAGVTVYLITRWINGGKS